MVDDFLVGLVPVTTISVRSSILCAAGGDGETGGAVGALAAKTAPGSSASASIQLLSAAAAHEQADMVPSSSDFRRVCHAADAPGMFRTARPRELIAKILQ
jgi:hypothetical protein